VTILEKINQAQSQKDLDILVLEIILSKNHKELTEAFKLKNKELDMVEDSKV
jgi:hypothetical protein